MSYWPELLIETYHTSIETAGTLLAVAAEAEKDSMAQKMALDSRERMLLLANKIKKRMKSLGYYDCWEDNNGMEVEVP